MTKRLFIVFTRNDIRHSYSSVVFLNRRFTLGPIAIHSCLMSNHQSVKKYVICTKCVNCLLLISFNLYKADANESIVTVASDNFRKWFTLFHIMYSHILHLIAISSESFRFRSRMRSSFWDFVFILFSIFVCVCVFIRWYLNQRPR